MIADCKPVAVIEQMMQQAPGTAHLRSVPNVREAAVIYNSKPPHTNIRWTAAWLMDDHLHGGGYMFVGFPGQICRQIQMTARIWPRIHHVLEGK